MAAHPISEPVIVDGKRVTGDATRPVTNPADGSVLGEVPQADDAAIDAAIEAASAAFPGWAGLPAEQRADYLARLGDWLAGNTGYVSRLITLEQGKPLSEARSEVAQAAKSFRYYAAEALRVTGETIPTSSPTIRSRVMYQPLGVAACFAGFNYPLGLMSWKVAPALAAGCTVVAKPSVATPFSTLALARGANEDCGLPPGVFNVVTGPGEAVGDRLVTHPAVRKVSFTGSTATGTKILRRASAAIKRVTLELGGHSPLIVAADAPLGLAVKDAAKRAFRNAGQLCNSVNRVYVQASVAEELTAGLVAATRRLTAGFGLDDPEPDLGPLTTGEGLARVQRHVRDALDHGGTLLTGGGRPPGRRLADGLFYQPTVISGATDDMLICCEETFGPVVPIVVVADMEEAFERANSLEYGLVAYLYTRDLRLATLGAERLEFGTVNINNVGGGDVPYPYAGWKKSGLGTELSRHGLKEYLAVKHVREEVGY